ncbi:hypothetical protein FQR65_LT16299 [Abscondita terminalis]|nr:hypothetical protein FQR65_LT16299 [Abscondita terminalis]
MELKLRVAGEIVYNRWDCSAIMKRLSENGKVNGSRHLNHEKNIYALKYNNEDGTVLYSLYKINREDSFMEEILQYENAKVMNTLSYKTVSANKATANKEWVVVDADGQPLGRLASKVAKILRGKHKTNFTPHVDCGDNVIILNAEKVALSGNKWADKEYIWHTGYPGVHKIGRRKTSVARVYVKPGAGNITVNGKDAKTYFCTDMLVYKLNQPFLLTETAGQYDVTVNVFGGGITGQAEAIRLATKKQAKEVVAKHASELNMPYITERWPGGMLTNFVTIRKAVKKMNAIDKMKKDGTFETLSKKERLQVDRQRANLEKNLGSIADMVRLPSAIFVVDIMREHIAVTEAKKLGIPVFGIVDTNSDPRKVDFVIPGNDDASKSIDMILSVVSESIKEGQSQRKAEKEKSKEGEKATADADADFDAE